LLAEEDFLISFRQRILNTFVGMALTFNFKTVLAPEEEFFLKGIPQIIQLAQQLGMKQHTL